MIVAQRQMSQIANFLFTGIEFALQTRNLVPLAEYQQQAGADAEYSTSGKGNDHDQR
ncbi:MAG: hypothetical protein Kow0096_11060 [Thiohalomonadaceae bacterium]